MLGPRSAVQDRADKLQEQLRSTQDEERKRSSDTIVVLQTCDPAGRLAFASP